MVNESNSYNITAESTYIPADAVKGVTAYQQQL
jgi:hypothetical protein